MTLEFVYLVALGVGVALIALSLILDGVPAQLPFRFRGAEMLTGPVTSTAAAVFGAAGLVGLLVFDMGRVSAALALTATVLVGGVNAVLFTLVKHRETIDAFERGKLVGMRGVATLGMGPRHLGRVAVHYAGMTRSLIAASNDEIKAGEEIVVLDVVENHLFVAPGKAAVADEPLPEQRGRTG